MANFQALPSEILKIIIEYLVITIGIRKAVLLRTVGRAFDSAILNTICLGQVVDSLDPRTPRLWNSLTHPLRAKISLVKSRSAEASRIDWLSVIARVNSSLDNLTDETNRDILQQRHESVAETASLACYGPLEREIPYDARWEAQNLFSGAIIIGDLPLVESLLASQEPSASSIDVNGVTPCFARPLILAAAWGRMAIVRYLLDHGARPDMIGNDLDDGKSSRSDSDDEEDEWGDSLAIWFLGCGNRHPSTAPSALRAAILGGHEDIVLLLLLPPYRLSSSTTEYMAAIVAAARVGLDYIDRLFEAAGKSLSDFPELGQVMIWGAIKYDRKEVVRWLLDNGLDVNTTPSPMAMYTRGPLQYAASLGNASMMHLLLERGADINFKGEARGYEKLPVEGAARWGQEDVVEMLLELGADPLPAFEIAARNSQPRVVKLILDKFPDLVQRDEGRVGRLACRWALRCRNLTTVDLLVEHGVSLNEGYEDSESLPMNIVKESWVRRHLISLGARETGSEDSEEKFPTHGLHSTVLQEHTWQWEGKY